MKNEITLAICSYNAERYIEGTLQCIINQTFQNFDLLIVNDCSTDNSIVIAEAFLQKMGRPYTLINFEINKGLAEGRAYVEKNTNTKYILFIDADDCPKLTLVEKLYNKIKSDSDIMAVGCYNEFIDECGKKIFGGHTLGSITKEDFYKKAKTEKLIFMQPTAIIDREIVLSVGGRNVTGFPEGKARYQDLCEDLDLWTRMSDLHVHGKAILVIPEILLQYRKHSNSMSASNVYMLIRMKHIKTNLKRRRVGKKELSFVEFIENISPIEMKQWERQNSIASDLRRGFIFLTRGNILKGSYLFIKSLLMNPRYFWQKLKANLTIFK